MTRAAVLFLMLSASVALAQGRAAAPNQPLLDARKKAVEELTKLRGEMAQLGYKGEVDDCDSVIKKILEPSKSINDKGMGTPYPGDEKLAVLMKSWSDAGDRLSAIYKEAAGQLEGDPKLEAEMYAGWFESWSHIAKGVLHLNRRRKFCKLTPVMADWSGTLGGYLHGVYMAKNKDNRAAMSDPHYEDGKLPGYTLEGAAAAGGILGGGSSEYVMDSWLGSEYHREPVWSRNCSRVCFGGLAPQGWWSCKNGGGGSGNVLADVITFPGDGDTDISPVFGGEGPNPLSKYNMTQSGTLFVIDFLRGKPKKPTVTLKDPDGNAAELLELGKAPMSFVAKNALKGNTKYTVEVVGQDGTKFSFSFTTSAGFGAQRGNEK
ncbi:MAG: hypothetical protein AAB074_14120 [Planctomycetota bacterium]